ncbi:NYN domain-containing protein [Acinetobacter sp. WCHAc060033]|uniref:NYN domain-containing protein n=1 Tax=Acinetobacter TaxID=469 RepID=UPI00102370F0|nr:MULTISPECIES: NYN domain-containing protein [Acinetobacter]RZG70717.1 NYN domain-containing protein [Acinetobacter wuhouensis]RZG79221.1 NYN domain-containing protein [Acinetobacter sp. WCHAc060033]
MSENLDKRKIVVLIDADNAQYSKIESILEEIAARGQIITKRAYGDWSQETLKNWKTILNTLAIQPIQQFAYTSGKNATDSSIIIDAMDLLYGNRHDTFVIVSSDSDFTRLASRLRESEIFVIGFGQSKTPVAFRNACDDFIFTENLNSNEEQDSNGSTNQIQKVKKVTELVPLLTKAWSQFREEDSWANLSIVGTYIKRSRPDFDPRTYGCTKLSDIIRKLEKYYDHKMISINGSKASIMVFRLKKST